MISALLVLLLVFVGVSDAGDIFWRATNCDSPLVYCVRERVLTFCVDFKDFTVKWKFHFDCLPTRSSCFYGEFPCKASPKSPDLHANTENTNSSSSPSSRIEWKTAGGKRRALSPSSSVLLGSTEEGPEKTTTSATAPSLVFAGIEEEKSMTLNEGETQTTKSTSSTPITQIPPIMSSLSSAESMVNPEDTIKVAQPTPPIACNGTGRHPGHFCNEYYECIVVWWWLDLRLRYCAEGFAFSVANRTCVPTAESDCSN